MSIDTFKLTFSELQDMYDAGDHVGLKRYLCRVTGRKFCEACGGFHTVSWKTHPMMMLREFIRTFIGGGR